MNNSLRYPSRSIELWHLHRLVPSAANARTHSAEQVEQIAASILEFGFTNPILVDGEGNIVAGHARLLAARELGLSEVPVIVLGDLTDLQKRAYLLADNKLALNAGWDEELLRTELQALAAEGFPLHLTGFSQEELALLAEATSEQPPPDPPEQPCAQPVCRTGDTWRAGPHRIHCGDALSPASLERALQGVPAHMTFTDPPYNVNYGASNTLSRRHRRPIANDDLGDAFAQFLQITCTNLLCFTLGAIYISMSSSELYRLQQAFLAAGGHWSTFIIWAKNTFTLGHADYQRQFEPLLYGWREGAQRYWCGDRNQGDVWWIDKPLVNDLHPTMKPIELVERAVRNSSRRGDTVLDPFAGSGTTLMACERTGRQARLVELDPVYVDVILARWYKLTGEHAVLEADGRRFQEIAAERGCCE